MRDMVKPLAAYQSHQLWHPLGHRAVSIDSEVPCEMWKNVHMNQHNGHEMKLQRMAGNMSEVHRVMSEYLKVFDRWKVAQETNNYSRFAIAASQLCDWQAFSATANLEALRAAVAGIIRHRGGLNYLSVEDSEKIILKAVPNGEDRMDIVVEGIGAYAVLKADGKAISGTLQLPSDVMCGQLTVLRTNDLPEHPILGCALDLPVRQVVVKERQLQFICSDNAYTPVCLYSKNRPVVLVNGEPVIVEWHADNRSAWLDRLWHDGDVVTARTL